jgi:hypothetical protein
MIFSNALHDIAKKKERTLYGRVEKSLGGDPQTLPAGVRSSCASKKPKLLTQQASPVLGERRTLKRRKVIDFDQTAPLTLF